MKSATHAYIKSRLVTLSNGDVRNIYTARIPDMARGYREYDYIDDYDTAQNHVKEWNNQTLKMGGYK